jgi:hypothetical protein
VCLECVMIGCGSDERCGGVLGVDDDWDVGLGGQFMSRYRG